MASGRNLARIAALLGAALFCALAAFFVLPSARRAAPPFVPADLSALPPLEVGDWALRMGTEADSRFIRQMSSGAFSHIGLIVALQPEVLVAHATTAEAGQTPSEGVLLTPLAVFFAPDRTADYAIVRPQFLDAAQKQALARAVRQKVGEPFVLAAKNQSHLYCTTLLADEIARLHSDFAPRWQYVSAPVFRGEYLFPQAFVEYPGVHTIYHAAHP